MGQERGQAETTSERNGHKSMEGKRKGVAIPINRFIIMTERIFETSIGSLYAKVNLASDKDRCIIFWPSLFTDNTLFAEVEEELRSNPDFSNTTSVLLDPPGHGQSTFKGKKLTFKDCARAVSEILDQLDRSKCIFVGCAWGGLVGIHFAATYPERVSAMVSRYNRLFINQDIKQSAKFEALQVWV